MKRIILFILGLVFTQHLWAQDTPKVKAKSSILKTEYIESEHNRYFSSPQSAKKKSPEQTTTFIMEEESRELLSARATELEATIEKHRMNPILVEKLNVRLIALRKKISQLEQSLPNKEKDN